MMTLTDQIEAYFDGRLDAAAVATLQKALRGNAEAQRQYLIWATLQSELAWQHRAGAEVLGVQGSGFRIQQESNTPTLSVRRSRMRSVWYFAAAALIALAVTAWFTLFSSTPHSELHTPNSPPVALLSDLHDAVFAEGQWPMNLGGELSAGPIRLVSGKAQVMFNSTAVVDLTGPCEFKMTGSNHGQLISGRIEAYVPRAAQGFTVDLLHGTRLIDLGTRFSVELNQQPAAFTLNVSEGRVRVETETRSVELAAGQMLRCDPLAGLFDLHGSSLPLVNGDFETGDMTGWERHMFDATRKLEGVSVVPSAPEQNEFSPPAGASGQYAMRLGFRYQQVSLRCQTPHRVEPDTDYTITVRAGASDQASGGEVTQDFQLIFTMDNNNILVAPCVATSRWQTFALTVPADQLTEYVGQPIEIRFYKPEAPQGAFVWLDDVQLWRGRIDPSHSAANENAH